MASTLLGLIGSVYAVSPVSQTERSGDVRLHLEEIVSVLEREWLYRSQMDWSDFRKRVFQQASAAKTIPESYAAIRFALSLLGDKHSYYVPAEGNPIFNPESPTQSTGECTPEPAVIPPLPSDIGYVRIQITPSTPSAAIQEALRKGDTSGIVGWIVDLRNSRGGNMWPAVAGVGPLLGEGTAGFFVDANMVATPWGYTHGTAWLGDEIVAQADEPHVFKSPNPRVAVLTDIGVASSGEAIAIGFRGRPNTKSFGMPTCGLSTTVQQFALRRNGTVAQSARIAVVNGVMADRKKITYGTAVVPDELVAAPADVVPRAIAWLRGN